MRWLVMAAAVACASSSSSKEARAEGEYPLDALPREAAVIVEPCPDVPLVTYRGATLPLNRPVQVHRALVRSVRRLEALVRATAIEVYGKPPVRLVTAGAYSCRKMRAGRRWLSEHSLGNAIDILGVDFATFQVRVKKHWNARGADAIHSRFLRLLARRVIADGRFRVVLGPSHRDHGDHFHFDMAPYRLVDVFGERRGGYQSPSR